MNVFQRIGEKLIDSYQLNLMKNNSRWVVADTYDHTRRVPKQGKNGGKGRRNDSYRTFPGDNRYNRRMVNCVVGEEMEYEYDNGDYRDGDRGNSYYQWGIFRSRVNFEENKNCYPPN